jgi:DnaJ-class molecular chaperone
MTYPPMRCESCSGEGVIEFDRSHDDRTEAVQRECSDCAGTGIEPDDDDDEEDEE